MANLIIEKSPSIKWYSDLHPFFALIESTVRANRWLWTDVDMTSELPVPHNAHGRYLLDGDTLFDFTVNRPQFVWSVFSALPPDYELDPIAIPRESIPYADGNPDFWRDSPRPQFSDALFEIVCWDSSATLLIGAEDADVLNAFCAAYPGEVDLDAENRSRG